VLGQAGQQKRINFALASWKKGDGEKQEGGEAVDTNTEMLIRIKGGRGNGRTALVHRGKRKKKNRKFPLSRGKKKKKGGWPPEPRVCAIRKLLKKGGEERPLTSCNTGPRKRKKKGKGKKTSLVYRQPLGDSEKKMPPNAPSPTEKKEKKNMYAGSAPPTALKQQGKGNGPQNARPAGVPREKK